MAVRDRDDLPRGQAAGFGLLLAALGFAAACGGGAEGPTLALEPGPQPDARVVVSGLPSRTAKRLARLEPHAPGWREVFVVQSAGSVDSSVPPLAGSYSVDAGSVAFTPDAPFLAGRSYRALWRGVGGASGPLELTFTIPRSAGRQALVAAVYPSSEAVPANLSRLYVHFSRAMSPGHASRHLHLLDSDGHELLPPLPAGEELWNRGRDRLTVRLAPPGESGGASPLEAGREARLIIDPAWPDAGGRPLGAGVERRFAVRPAVEHGPEPGTWRLLPPAGPGERLVVEFPQPLDHALLLRSLTVRDARGARVRGEPSVGHEERSWSFAPAIPWVAGRYSLEVDGGLEDLAGHRMPGAEAAGRRRTGGRELRFEVSPSASPGP